MERRHGGPEDRGSADAYYGRPYRPHYFTGATHMSPEVTTLTPEETEAYRKGYVNETDRKEW